MDTFERPCGLGSPPAAEPPDGGPLGPLATGTVRRLGVGVPVMAALGPRGGDGS
jgi:hypothetical protein